MSDSGPEKSYYETPDGVAHFQAREVAAGQLTSAPEREWVQLSSIGETCADREACQNIEAWVCVCLEQLLQPPDED